MTISFHERLHWQCSTCLRNGVHVVQSLVRLFEATCLERENEILCVFSNELYEERDANCRETFRAKGVKCAK